MFQGHPRYLSKRAKDYLASEWEEQLQARVSPSQAEPFFLSDLIAIAQLISDRLNVPGLAPKQILILAQDQAFLKALFFAGDRAGDLGRVKTQEIMYFPQKEGLLFKHIFTRTLRDGSGNLLAFKRCVSNKVVRPITAIEVYISICDLLAVPWSGVSLSTAERLTGEVMAAPFVSSAAQSRLSFYVCCLPQVFGSRRFPSWVAKWFGDFAGSCGAHMSDILAHVACRSSKTAEHYLKSSPVPRRSK